MTEPRIVSVAVDAAGAAGLRAYSYAVPASLGELAPGEAVLIEFGRRQALGIVLGPGEPVAGVETKEVLSRVRADGPLLPPLAMRLAAWISTHYLAPPAITLRAMLPPGLLERLELVAELRPGPDVPPPGQDSPPPDPHDVAILEALATGPRQVRLLDAPEGRPALLRRLRAHEAAGRLALDWTLLAAGAGPRWVRFVRAATPVRATTPVEAGALAPTSRLGPRQRDLLDELATAGPDGIAAPELAARHGSSTVASLARRGLVTIDTREAPRRPLASRPAGRRGSRPAGSSFSEEQLEAVAAVELGATAPKPVLLDGVTGGGKTAIYVELIDRALAAGRPALVLVPEISLALPLVDRLRADLEARVAILHSGLGEGERADEWRRIRRGDVDVVVGTRVAVLAPLADVGLIVVDEEHDPAYKSDRTPRLQARDTAIELARLAGAPVVLGSATPSVESEGRARSGEYVRRRLPIRLSGAPPSVEVVDLREELAAGNTGMLSRVLSAALGSLDTAAGDQAILVINRRGTASVVLCRDCGHVATCPDCTRPLVFHQAGGTLRCHHCGRAWPMPSRCPSCGSARIRYLGGGTERVEREVHDRFPALRTGRLDRDVVQRRGAAEKVIDDFSDRRLDVLVGTSLVTKGLDIPNVTLVGVVSADVALNLPDERAAERTYQLLAQAVGRAGRGERPGQAIIQTYQPDHPAIQAIATDRAAAFYDAELEARRRFGSPPFGRLLKLTVALPDRSEAEAAGRTLAETLRDRAAGTTPRVDVAGPAPAFIARRGDRWRYNVVLRGADPVAFLGDPPGLPWSIDVDPESLL